MRSAKSTWPRAWESNAVQRRDLLALKPSSQQPSTSLLIARIWFIPPRYIAVAQGTQLYAGSSESRTILGIAFKLVLP